MASGLMIKYPVIPVILLVLIISTYSVSSIKTVGTGGFTPATVDAERTGRPKKWEGTVIVESYFKDFEMKDEKVKILKKFDKGTNSTIAYEGDPADLFCNLTRGELSSNGGNQYKVAWRINTGEYKTPDYFYNLPEKYNYTETNNLTIIRINKVNLTDRGWYQCALWNSRNCTTFNHAKPGCIIQTYEIQLRVKQRGEELIPSVSIGVEVVLLFLVILIYEKRKSKTEVEESDTDGSPDHQPLHG